MTNKAKELLTKMANEYDASGKTSFDSDFYISFSDNILTELANDGCITIVNDVVGSICLTELGYKESKK